MISKSALGASPPATRVTENGNPKKQQAKMALSAQKREVKIQEKNNSKGYSRWVSNPRLSHLQDERSYKSIAGDI